MSAQSAIIMNETIIKALGNLQESEQGEQSMSILSSLYDMVHARRKLDLNYIPFELAATDEGDMNNFLDRTFRESTITVIIGARGSGKTALGMRLLEAFDKRSPRKCYGIGYNSVKKLPMWIHKVNSADEVPRNAVALVDEGAIVFSARDSQKAANKMIGKLMAIARHKNLSLIFITQDAAMMDINIFRLANTLIMKEPELLGTLFSRGPISKLYTKAIHYFDKIRKSGLKGKDLETELKRNFYVIDKEFQGLLKGGLPEFWSHKVSTSFANANV